MNKDKYIVCVYRADHPHAGYGADHKIPWVACSTHPRFDAGTRFDYGFLQIALSEGYTVLINPEPAAPGSQPAKEKP